MLEAPATEEIAFDQTKAPFSSVRLVGGGGSHESLRERIAEARRLVERASHVLGTASEEEPLGLRMARALVLSLLDELAVLDNRWSR